ncbi:MAG: HNH endonuclease [Lachnospiraceae bacterium]|nr:HNH endonuclease [Lachnospiraceae bacterium]
MKEYARTFYSSKAWKATREAVKIRAFGLCERCTRQGVFKPGKIAHHKVYLTTENISNPKIALDFSQIEFICEDCHNKEHKEKSKKNYRFNSKGEIVQP